MKISQVFTNRFGWNLLITTLTLGNLKLQIVVFLNLFKVLFMQYLPINLINKLFKTKIKLCLLELDIFTSHDIKPFFLNCLVILHILINTHNSLYRNSVIIKIVKTYRKFAKIVRILYLFATMMTFKKI
jgi:hypothetical protein